MYEFFKKKFKAFALSFIYLAGSFIIQLGVEFISSLVDNIVFSFVINIIITLVTNKIDDKFSDTILDNLENNTNFWSNSDTKFYKIIFKTLFSFINQGLSPLFTYLIVQKTINKGKDDSYLDLVNKMFVVLEMKGFGYPLIDLLIYGFFQKSREMKKKTDKIMSQENVEKEISQRIENIGKLSQFELEETFKKDEMSLEDNYSEILSLYYITMFYFSLYPVGLIQSFLNLFFKFIIEKNFLLIVYKRPENIDPKFGFLCFEYYNLGYFLFLCGNIIFFKDNQNKNSFGPGYIIFMFVILIFPFLTKLVMFLIKKFTKSEEKETNNNTDEINKKIVEKYKVFNPYLQKEAIIQILEEYKRKKFLNKEQYDQAYQELDDMNFIDFYELTESLKTPIEMTFETKYLTKEDLKNNYIYTGDYSKVEDKEYYNFYYDMMQFGFLKYLEPGNLLRPKRKRFDFFPKNEIKSETLSLLNDSIQENISNSDSGDFVTFKRKENEIIAYVCDEKIIKLANICDK